MSLSVHSCPEFYTDKLYIKPQYYGLSHPTVRYLIQQLPNAQLVAFPRGKYRFIDFSGVTNPDHSTA
jgi:hypothetical protein